MAVPAGGTNYIDVVFGKEYQNTPFIVATPETSWTDAIQVTTYNGSNKGCRINCYNRASASTNVTIHWIAAGKLK